MTRNEFLTRLASLPLLGWLAPAPVAARDWTAQISILPEHLEFGLEYEFTHSETGEVLFARVFSSTDHECDACSQVFDKLTAKHGRENINIEITPVHRHGNGCWRKGGKDNEQT